MKLANTRSDGKGLAAPVYTTCCTMPHVLNAHGCLESAGFYDGAPFNQRHGDARLDHLGQLLVLCSPAERDIAIETVDMIVHTAWEADGGRIAVEAALADALQSVKAVA